MQITEQAKYEESSVEGKGEERMRNEAETEKGTKSVIYLMKRFVSSTVHTVPTASSMISQHQQHPRSRKDDQMQHPPPPPHAPFLAFHSAPLPI